MANFLLLILIVMVSLWFGSRNMFWRMLSVLGMTWLIIGSAIAAGVLLENIVTWFIGVYA